MDIHFISTLTPEDEDRFAPVVIDTIKAVLDALPLSYTVRIETASGRVYQHTKADEPGSAADMISGRSSAYAGRRLSVS